MRNLLPIIDRWRGQAKQVAMATLIQIYGSAPQPLGARMAISSAGEMAGSVSGGCVEGAIVQEALEVLATGRPRSVEYGIADELAQSVGLACGGQIGVFIEPWPPDDLVVADYERAVRNARLVALGLVVRGPLTGGRLLVWPGKQLHGSLGNTDLDHLAADRAQPLLEQQQSAILPCEVEGQASSVFIDVQPPPPRLVIVGAVHIAIPLITYAKVLGFYTIVLDARSAFATPERFQHVDRLQVGWPADALAELEVDEGTYVVVLTHDEKIDDPALVYACRSPARYIGALGSRRTHAKRCERLTELGLTEGELARIHAPIGISIGARTPEEIAISIAAELVAARNGH
ncbi:MAG: XdhC/CoxI family protein [Caldilineaceae bacterium]